MIIQSKFHDYYDSLAGQYRDEKIVYQRDEEIITTPISNEISNYMRLDYIAGSRKYKCINVLIFCGKIYPFFEVELTYPTVIRDFKTPYAHMEEPKKKSYISSSTIHLPDYLGGGIENQEAVVLNKTIAPIILIENGERKNRVTKNPCLEDLKFHLHPFEVYQALFQFLAPTEPEMVKTEDKYKITSHGMDKTSFRRDKGGPTRKRKKQVIATQQ